MTSYDLEELLRTLLAGPSETELVEFKEASEGFDSDKLGKYFSALSNEANLKRVNEAWLVFGVNDVRKIVGTAFRADPVKLQSLKREVAEHCTNRLTFRDIHEITVDGKRVLLFEIPPATTGQPTAWKGHHYGRDGESLGALNTDERHRIEGRIPTQPDFERGIAYPNASVSHVLELLDWESYYALCKYPEPADAQEIIMKLVDNKAIVRENGGLHITNLGAILFARELRKFDDLSLKYIRIILYEGTGRTGGKDEKKGQKGYAVGFDGAANWLNDRLPSREEIGRARRETVPVYPVKAIRELMANAMIHQDFTVSGSTLMIEVFVNRIEITNPGTPLINVLEFLNHTAISRNEVIAAVMERLGICERRGSGIDKVVEECEKHQLPAPNFIRGDNYTQAVLYPPRPLREMDRRDKIRACYQHACLKQANGEQMTNQSFRERMGIAESNYPMASRIISETLAAGFIKPYDLENKSKKLTKYIPSWA